MDLDDWLEVRVSRRWFEAVDVACFELTPAGDWPLPHFQPGAHIDVCTPAGLVRSYSLCNAPTEGNRYVIAVLKERDGADGSASLHERLRMGDWLKISAPRNDFPLLERVSYSVFIAGGIGITPLIGMAETMWLQGGAFELHYCARNAERAAFSKSLVKCSYSARVRFYWSEECGRVNFNRAMARIPALSHVYACGPAGFIESVVTASRKSRLPSHRLHLQRFKPNEVIRDQELMANADYPLGVGWMSLV